MSAYINFFLRGGDKFYPIGTYSRLTLVYHVFKDRVPWEQIVSITSTDLIAVSKEVADKIAELETKVENHKAMINVISAFNNSAEEKMEAIEDQREIIEEINSDIRRAKYCSDFISYLGDIIDEVAWGEYDGIDANHYIYCGIEVGFPTLDDVKESE